MALSIVCFLPILQVLKEAYNKKAYKKIMIQYY